RKKRDQNVSEPGFAGVGLDCPAVTNSLTWREHWPLKWPSKPRVGGSNPSRRAIANTGTYTASLSPADCCFVAGVPESVPDSDGERGASGEASRATAARIVAASRWA